MNNYLFLIESNPYKYTQDSNGTNIFYDFCYETINIINFHKWWYGKSCVYSWQLHSFNDAHLNLNELIKKHNKRKIIPIGSIEFVLKFYKMMWNVDNIKPINIPIELQKEEYLKRNIFYSKEIDFIDDNSYFCKNVDLIKDEENGIYKLYELNKNKNWFCSELIDIKAEFRCFIYKNELLDYRCYSGDFKLKPDYKLIENMMQDCSVANNNSYTLDIGINSKHETCIIEVHDFLVVGCTVLLTKTIY